MRRRGEEQATDIKSNNPHLAGGEKQFHFAIGARDGWYLFWWIHWNARLEMPCARTTPVFTVVSAIIIRAWISATGSRERHDSSQQRVLNLIRPSMFF